MGHAQEQGINKTKKQRKVDHPNRWSVMCSFRKNPYPPHGRSLEILRGRGVLRAKILEAKYEDKLEFPGGSGVENKKIFSGEEYGYILELHNV